MKIHTIADFERASHNEIQACKNEITVERDLRRYLAYLNSPEGYRIQSSFEVGYNGRERSRGLHASSLAKPKTCQLKHWFDVTGEVEADQTVKMKLQLTFDLGTVIHALFQAYLIDMYEYLDDGELKNHFTPEVSLASEKLLITKTTTDGRFTAPRYRFLIELKSMKEGGDYGYESVVKRPLADNVRQLMTYMKIDDCPFGLLLYFCKNNSELVEHVVPWDQETWEEVESEALPIVDAVNTGIRPEARPSAMCRDCVYLRGCEAGKGFVENASSKKSKLATAAIIARNRSVKVRPR